MNPLTPVFTHNDLSAQLTVGKQGLVLIFASFGRREHNITTWRINELPTQLLSAADTLLDPQPAEDELSGDTWTLLLLNPSSIRLWIKPEPEYPAGKITLTPDELRQITAKIRAHFS